MASPFNANNRLLKEEDVLDILRLRCRASSAPADGLQDLCPRDLGPYQRAFTHKSYCTTNHQQWLITHPRPAGSVAPPLQAEFNLRLEWLGDSVLQLLVTDVLLERHPGRTPGWLSSIRCGLVSNGYLGRLMLAEGWDAHVLLDANLERMGGRRNLELLADCFEALVGAVYRDLGHDACRRWVAAVFGDRLGPQSEPKSEPKPVAPAPSTPAITFDAEANEFSDEAKLCWSVDSPRAWLTLYDQVDGGGRLEIQHELTQAHLDAPIVRPEGVAALQLLTGNTPPRVRVPLLASAPLTVRQLLRAVSDVYQAKPGMTRSLRHMPRVVHTSCPYADAHNLCFKRLAPLDEEREGEALVETHTCCWDSDDSDSLHPPGV